MGRRDWGERRRQSSERIRRFGAAHTMPPFEPPSPLSRGGSLGPLEDEAKEGPASSRLAEAARLSSAPAVWRRCSSGRAAAAGIVCRWQMAVVRLLEGIGSFAADFVRCNRLRGYKPSPPTVGTGPHR